MPAGHWQQRILTGNGDRKLYFDALWRPVVEETFDNADIAGTLSQTVTRYDADGRVQALAGKPGAVQALEFRR